MKNNKTPLIDLRDVIKRYPVGDNDFYQALNGVTVSIHEGEFVAIMGPSGSGKSTMMHIMGALDVPSEGDQYFKGKDISEYSEDQLAEIRNQEIGFVFQSFNLLPKNTVFENVERPMIYGDVPADERERRVMEALKLVKIDDKAHNLANHISGGQIQRVAIARAMIMDPSIILADEPTGNLDSKTSEEIMNLFRELNGKGRTIVLITHEEDLAAYADRILHIIDGRIIHDVWEEMTPAEYIRSKKMSNPDFNIVKEMEDGEDDNNENKADDEENSQEENSSSEKVAINEEKSSDETLTDEADSSKNSEDKNNTGKDKTSKKKNKKSKTKNINKNKDKGG